MEIIAFTGAGISKDSGIPTFEEMGDLRKKLSRDFADNHPEEYEQTIEQLIQTCTQAKPNDAHFALAQYNIPVITMNIDELHQKAGSQNVLELHGHLPKTSQNASLLVGQPVLYGDLSFTYNKAIALVTMLGKGDILLVIGSSGYTSISRELEEIAFIQGANIIHINKDAKTEVRKTLHNLLD